MDPRGVWTEDEVAGRDRAADGGGRSRAREIDVGDHRGYRMRRLLALTDVSALIWAWLAAALVLELFGRGMLDWPELAVAVALTPLWVGIGILMGLYHRSDRRLDPSVADEAGLLIVLVTVWSWLYLMAKAALSLGEANPVKPALILWAAAIVSLILFRAAARTWARRRDWFVERVAILGGPKDSMRVQRRLERHPEFGLEPVDVRDLSYPESSDDGAPGFDRFEEELDELLGSVEEKGISRAIVATGPPTVRARSELLQTLNEAGVQVDLVAGDPDTVIPEPLLNYVEGLPVVTVPVMRRHKLGRVLKRVMDVGLASLALGVLSPLLAFCAVRIKLDSPGPVFFCQDRIGKNREPFRIVKFRSMVEDAEELREDYVEDILHGGSEGPELFKVDGDPRVTKFGAFMRRWSIDELPQLFNVVKGDMSLVGPRPLPPDEAAQIDGRYEARFKVLPGVTGAWQAQGRSDIGFEDMLKLDYTYVKSWTFKEDLKLMLRTVEVIVQGRGAY